MAIKQYTISPAYIGNDKVTRYIDGENVGYKIMSYWESHGYCKALEDEGYTKAYDLDELHKRIEEAEEELRQAQQAYKDAIPFALFKTDIER